MSNKLVIGTEQKTTQGGYTVIKSFSCIRFKGTSINATGFKQREDGSFSADTLVVGDNFKPVKPIEPIKPVEPVAPKPPVLSIGTLHLDKPKSPQKQQSEQQQSFGYRIQENVTIVDYNGDKPLIKNSKTVESYMVDGKLVEKSTGDSIVEASTLTNYDDGIVVIGKFINESTTNPIALCNNCNGKIYKSTDHWESDCGHSICRICCDSLEECPCTNIGTCFECKEKFNKELLTISIERNEYKEYCGPCYEKVIESNNECNKPIQKTCTECNSPTNDCKNTFSCNRSHQFCKSCFPKVSRSIKLDDMGNEICPGCVKFL